MSSSSSKKEKDNTSSEVRQEQQEEHWEKLSFILHVLLPIAGILIFLKEKHIFSKLLLQLDRNCVSVFCPSFSQREKLLKWAGSRLPETWSSQSRTLTGGVLELWSDGSLLCTLINSAIPGACPNPHRHWKKPPLHAQAVAYKYLGVIPIFTESDLKGSLTINLERNFLHYLTELQHAITKLSEKEDIPKTISMHYIARGMGLFSGEQHRKTVFYVYPNKTLTSPNSNIIVHIRGPYSTYGKAVIPQFHNELFTTPEISLTSDSMTTKKLVNGRIVKPKKSFVRSFSLPFMQYSKKHMGDNIIIDVTMEDDRAKVTYIPKNYGIYEIIMISNGEMLRGCPFNVHILNNTSGIEDNFNVEVKVEDVPTLRKRKVLSKTIDFIDEEIAMTEVLKRYKRKDKKLVVDNKPKKVSKETKTNEEVDKNNEDGKVTTIATVLPKESFKTNGDTFKIDEENEDKDKLLHDQSKVDNNKQQLNANNETPAQKGDSIPEKQNSEGTSENFETKNLTVKEDDFSNHTIRERTETRDTIQKVNQFSDKQSKYKVVNDIPTSLRLKPTNESSDDDRKVKDVLEQKKQTFNDACYVKHDNKTFSDLSPRKVKTNKIERSEKFPRVQKSSNTNFDNGIGSKYFKNFINTSNKREIPKRISTETHDEEDIIKKIQYFEMYSSNETIYSFKNDSNNNSPNFHRGKNEQVRGIFSKNSHQKIQPHVAEDSEQIQTTTSTSPICPAHIVPEVESGYSRMSVAERRKIFAKKSLDRISLSTNSSFSETESADVSSKHKRFGQFEGLSVLNYLGSLKRSERKKRNTFALCSTVSLPNISLMEAGTFKNSVKERRNFWEKMSTSTSSLNASSQASLKRNSERFLNEKRNLNWATSNTSSSNTSVNTMEENSDFPEEKNHDLSKSADDILSMTNFVSQDASKKYKSVDHSLDKCTIMSIEERKRILLKRYEKENLRKDVPKTLENNVKNTTIVVNNIQKVVKENQNDDDDVIFSSIRDRIKKYDSSRNLSVTPNEEEKSEAIIIKKTENSSSETLNDSNQAHPEDLTTKERLTVKSHFKRAIKYFKNLEEKSLTKSNPNLSSKDSRQLSLDVPYDRRRRAGSLNLPKVSQRFSISNLYGDVFGERRGSFRGAANRSALVEALATFSRRENHSYKGDEDTILFEMFRKRTKTKRRKSIKSIFDVYY